MRSSGLLGSLFLVISVTFASPTWAEESKALACSNEARAIEEGIASIRTTTVSQQEDVAEIRSGFDALLNAIGGSSDAASQLRMELDVRLEVLKVRSRHNTPRIKDLHSRIASLMKCHGIKAPGNGTSKTR